MNPIYQTVDDFAAYCSQQSVKRLRSIVHIASSALFFAGKSIVKGFSRERNNFSRWVKVSALSRVPFVRLSMDWLSKNAQTASRRLFATLREEFQSMGIWTIEQQAPRQGKGQPITKLEEIDFQNLFNIARAAILRIHDLLGTEEQDPDWESLLPDHGFRFFAHWFLKNHGFPLLCSREKEEEILHRSPPLPSYCIAPIAPIAPPKPKTKPSDRDFSIYDLVPY